MKFDGTLKFCPRNQSIIYILKIDLDIYNTYVGYIYEYIVDILNQTSVQDGTQKECDCIIQVNGLLVIQEISNDDRISHEVSQDTMVFYLKPTIAYVAKSDYPVHANNLNTKK